MGHAADNWTTAWWSDGSVRGDRGQVFRGRRPSPQKVPFPAMD